MTAAPQFSRPARIALVAVGSVALAAPAAADPLVGTPSRRPSALIAESVAESVGLTRAWFTQASVDRMQGEVVGAAVDDNALYVLVSTGALQAIDRHTGVSLWTARLDPAGSPPMGPSVRGGRVAAVVGVMLHVLDTGDGRPSVVDEETGRRVEARRLEAAPGAPPVIGDTHVYVPASNGRLMVQPIDAEESLALRVSSPGELTVRPVLTDDRCVWSTMAGDVYSIPLNGRGDSVRVEDAGIVAGPALTVGERIMLVSRVGGLVSKQADNGRRLWRSALGERAAGSGVVVNGVAYVPTIGGATHAIDFETGRTLWAAPGLSAVISVSAERVYGLDSNGALVLLDAADGRFLGAVPGTVGLTAVTNPIDDRVYLISMDGLVQSLRESSAEEPVRHDGVAPQAEPAELAEEGVTAEEPSADAAEEGGSPFVDDFTGPAADEPLDDPFADDSPAEEDSDDPFGDDPFADF